MIHLSCTVKAGEPSVKDQKDIVVIAQLFGTGGISLIAGITELAARGVLPINAFAGIRYGAVVGSPVAWKAGHRAHQMRAWHGTTLIELGADSLDVQHSLRHSDAQSMKAYIRPSQDRIRVAMELLPRVDVPHVRFRSPVEPLRLAA